MCFIYGRPSIRALIHIVIQSLSALQEKVNHMSKNLDAIAADWPALKAAITEKLSADAAKIDELTAELAKIDADDPRAAEIDGEIKALTASIKGVVADTPAPASDANQSDEPSS